MTFQVGDRVRVANPTRGIYGEGTVIESRYGVGVRFDCFDYGDDEEDIHYYNDKWGLVLAGPPPKKGYAKWVSKTEGKLYE